MASVEDQVKQLRAEIAEREQAIKDLEGVAAEGIPAQQAGADGPRGYPGNEPVDYGDEHDDGDEQGGYDDEPDDGKQGKRKGKGKKGHEE